MDFQSVRVSTDGLEIHPTVIDDFNTARALSREWLYFLMVFGTIVL